MTMGLQLQIGQRVRVMGYAKGERLGSQICGKWGVVVDRSDDPGMVFVRFHSGRDGQTVFYDWVDERDLAVQ